jgi:hypothetical protein
MERAREFDPFDPAQKPILANNRSRGEAKILDTCSSSQIHLWSKSKILRRRDSTARRRATRRRALTPSSPNVSNLKSQISNRLTP